jgi:AcrR family transcriptional regulator
VASARRIHAGDSKTRTALLDAAEQLMLEEGYGAVTSRRVAARAGANAGLVYYYFGTMDDLFLAVFRRRADWTVERQAEALTSEQPLWALWDLTYEQAATVLNLEFLALGNHRKVIKTEVAKYSRKFRRMQLEALSPVLARYGIDPDVWPAPAVIVFMFGVARFLLMEDEYRLDVGHAETIAIVERFITEFEGKRRSTVKRAAAAGRARR